MNSRRQLPHPPQADLLGGGSEPSQVHRLFFALLPGEAVRSRIEQAAAGAAMAQHLRARMIRPARYHATLHFLGDHPMLREDIAKAALQAAAKVRAEPFELVLDSASGFHGREPPCVLRCTQTPSALQACATRCCVQGWARIFLAASLHTSRLPTTVVRCRRPCRCRRSIGKSRVSVCCTASWAAGITASLARGASGRRRRADVLQAIRRQKSPGSRTQGGGNRTYSRLLPTLVKAPCSNRCLLRC